jgi:hypothetical protein
MAQGHPWRAGESNVEANYEEGEEDDDDEDTEEAEDD